jgi:hypothetical protein
MKHCERMLHCGILDVLLHVASQGPSSAASSGELAIHRLIGTFCLKMVCLLAFGDYLPTFQRAGQRASVVQVVSHGLASHHGCAYSAGDGQTWADVEVSGQQWHFH